MKKREFCIHMRKTNMLDDVSFISTKVFSAQHNMRKDKMKYSKNNDLYKSSFMLFNYMSWFGVTFTKETVTRTYCPLNSLDSIRFFIYVLAYICCINGIYSLRIPLIMIYIMLSYTGLGILLNFALLLKKRKIFLINSKISDLGKYFKIDCMKSSRKKKTQTYGIISGFVIFIANISYFCLTAEFKHDSFWFQSYIKRDNYYMPLITYYVRICIIYCEIMSCGLITLSCALCCDTYFIIGTIIKSFNEKFKVEFSISDATFRKLILHYITVYKHLIVIIAYIDSALAECCLLIYSAAMINIFGSISFVFQQFRIDDPLIVILVTFAFLFGLLIIILLTFSATKASCQHDNLKILLIDGTRKILNLPNNLEIMGTYKIFVEIVNNTSIYFTVAGMFKISKSLILTTASAMLTYGIIIFQ